MFKKIGVLLIILVNLNGSAFGQDTTSPTITSFTFPNSLSGNKIGGIVPFRVTATDDVRVTRVEFYKDGILVESDSAAPWDTSIDFNGDPVNRDYTVTAKAYDAAGNASTSTFTVNKPDWNMRGAGATLAENGCFFSVWAPNADEAQLIGNFNAVYENGKPDVHYLMKDNRGYWFGFVPGCTAGHRYKYVIHNPGGPNNTAGTYWRLDPRAKDSDHSFNGDNGNEKRLDYNASIIVDPKYNWAPFTSPAFKDYIIYQLHIGSFAGLNDGIDMAGHGGDGTIARFGDVETKFQYIKELGFNAIELLPVHEFAADQSWGYNPALFFSLESAYGSPDDLRHFVNEAHKKGLAVIVDVVYNHVGPGDNSLWRFDGNTKDDGGIYFEGGKPDTPWGRGPAWWKQEVQDFFFDNAKMYITEYNVDGIRFDATTQIDGTKLRKVLWRIVSAHPDKYIIAEHLPDHPWITKTGNFNATWCARSHHEFQRAANGEDPVNKVASFLGWDGYDHSRNLVKYALGSHDDIGDLEIGNAEDGLTNWDKRHRYFTDLFGGRDNWDARAKARMGWALTATMPGTPMMFMGTEFHFNPPWGYWTDGSDEHGDHRINWSSATDSTAMPMRNLVTAINSVRWNNPALRSDTLSIPHRDHTNNVIAFKRWDGNSVVLTVVNLGAKNFTDHSYGVAVDSQGQWTQIFCSQDAAFGGWNGAGNAFYEPETRSDGKIYINLPKYSILVFKLKST
jgi:1,4-alpha-glucan branching enzyme